MNHSGLRFLTTWSHWLREDRAISAESVDAPTALGKHATEIYENFLENGGKGRDFSAILPYLAKKL